MTFIIAECHHIYFIILTFLLQLTDPMLPLLFPVSCVSVETMFRTSLCSASIFKQSSQSWSFSGFLFGSWKLSFKFLQLDLLLFVLVPQAHNILTDLSTSPPGEKQGCGCMQIVCRLCLICYSWPVHMYPKSYVILHANLFFSQHKNISMYIMVKEAHCYVWINKSPCKWAYCKNIFVLVGLAFIKFPISTSNKERILYSS